MVAKNTKTTTHASKPEKNKTKKDLDKTKNAKEKKKNLAGSNVSFGKISIDIIKPSSRSALADTDSSSAEEPEEIPKTGEELLKWTREQMSFISARSKEESEMALEEEQEIPIPPTPKKPKSEKIEKAPIKIKKKEGKKKKKSTTGKVSEEEFLDLTAPGPLEDEVMFQWRLRREEQRRLSRKKNRSEVTFLEPTTDVVKISSTSILKGGRRKTTKLTLAAKKEAQRLLEKENEERKRREELFQQDLMKHEQDEAEDIIREQKNATTLRRIRRFQKEQLDRTWELFRKAEVEHYRSCEKIPLVTKCDQLTFFVKQWEESVGEMSLEDLGSVCGVNLELLKRLDELIFYTSPNEQEKMEQWLWSSELLRSTQEEMLNRTMYNILSDVYKNLKIENLDYGEFQTKNDSFTLSIWLKLDWPVSMPNPKKPPGSATEVLLSEVDVICIFPPSLLCDQKALVCLHMPYDHVSDTCATFQPPPKPDCLTKDLSESNYEDKLRKLKYCYESHLRSEYVEKVETYKEKHPDDKYPFPFVLPEIELNEDIPRVPPQSLDPTPTEYVDLADDLLFDNYLKGMYVEASPDEVSLRQYQLVGGLYDIQLVYHPPQPQPLVKFHMTLRTGRKPSCEQFHVSQNSFEQ
ncbi:dynein axonemal intermediate chain 7 homolog [Coccinella septempunctata]|uniref:dynein axonemal intermediate chain 7 homolog n=1 Tax=Coccinella septempunctata TaxID=41139 RepID=UPI001D083D27|nr:dynein axonemal intermediate chain 7 homolog [Coccinella septempunctata]